MAAQSTFNIFLAGIDDKGLADQAVLQAARICDIRDGTLRLVHALGKQPSSPKAQIRVASEAADRLTRRLERLEQEGGLASGALTRRFKVFFGQPGEVLAEKAGDGPADVIFLGPHAKRGFVDFGSTAESMLAELQCCLWLQPCPVGPIGKVLTAVDGSEASMQALEIARRVCERMEADLTVLHCLKGAEKGASEEVEARLRNHAWNGVDYELVHADERPAKGILGRQEAIDLIVVGTYGRTGLKKALMGSVSSDVIRSARKPVLVVPRPNM